MKLLSVILSILILFLTVQPVCIAAQPTSVEKSCCADGCSEEDGSVPQDSGDHDDCRGCNPFQSCGCCIGSVIMPASGFSLNGPLPAPARTSPSPADVGLTGIPGSDFWQPPRSVRA